MNEKIMINSFQGVKKDLHELRDGQIEIVNSVNDFIKQIKEKKELEGEPINHRLKEPINRLTPINQATENLKYDDFSEQEKRIINMFLQHKEMALSYKDLGKLLNKSANTIKFQMRMITTKYNIFSKMIGDNNKNRFRLRQGIKIEKAID